MSTRIDPNRTEAETRALGAERTRFARQRLFTLIRRVGVWIPLAALTIWTVGPILITLSISFKSRGDVFADPGLIPANPNTEAYQEIFGRLGFQGAFVNSVLVGLGTAVLTLLIAVPAAYAFARFRFRGRHLLLLFTLLPRLIPSLGLMVPLYRLAVAVGALDNRLTLIVAFTGTVLPLAIWLLVGFFQQIPRDLEEAANVDGTTMLARVRYIVLPLAVPALITIGVLAFREAWNDFDLVLALTRTPGNRTLPYELFLLTTGTGLANNPGEAAFAILTLVPFIFVYLRIEKYVVGGITAGAMK
jgi:ABC-type glycerol-3-phosphate transport system permease component